MTMPYFQFDDGFSEPNPLVQTMRPAEQEQQPRFSGCVVRCFSVSTSLGQRSELAGANLLSVHLEVQTYSSDERFSYPKSKPSQLG